MRQVIFDLETSSLERDKCGIVQLAIKAYNEQGEVYIEKVKLYNPEVPINAEATAVHGYTNEMVKDKPTFKEDALKLKKIFDGALVIGYNIIAFDLPVLAANFQRAGISIDFPKVVDVMKLEKKIHSNSLAAVYKRYTGKDLEGAHDALADVKATDAILTKQTQMYSNDERFDTWISESGIPENSADLFGKLKKDKDGYLIFNFGKSKDTRVLDDINYANWMLGADFPESVKNLIKLELKKTTPSFKKQPESKMLFPVATQEELDSIEDLPF